MSENREIKTTVPDKFNNDEEKKAYELVLELGMEFERIDRTPEDENSEEVYELLGTMHLKNLLLCNAQKTKFYLLVMPASVPFKSNVLSKQLGTSRFSFAPEDILFELLGVRPGSASILGLHKDNEHKINLVFDERVLQNEFYCCYPCVNSASLKFKTKDILEKFLKYTGHFYSVVRM